MELERAKALEPNEFQVECLLRNLDSTDPQSVVKLADCWGREANNQQLQLTHSHAAPSDKKSEIALCIQKAQVLLEDNERFDSDTEWNTLVSVFAHTVHWYHRAKRAGHSFGDQQNLTKITNKLRRSAQLIKTYLTEQEQGAMAITESTSGGNKGEIPPGGTILAAEEDPLTQYKTVGKEGISYLVSADGGQKGVDIATDNRRISSSSSEEQSQVTPETDAISAIFSLDNKNILPDKSTAYRYGTRYDLNGQGAIPKSSGTAQTPPLENMQPKPIPKRTVTFFDYNRGPPLRSGRKEAGDYQHNTMPTQNKPQLADHPRRDINIGRTYTHDDTSRSPRQNYPRNNEPNGPAPELPRFKWNVPKFTGAAATRYERGLNVRDFVFQLENMSTLNNFPTPELHRVVFNYLEGAAQQWMLIHMRKFPRATWMDIRSTFLDRFSEPGGDTVERLALQQRQQGQLDIDDYVLEMESRNYRLQQPFSEYELVQIIRTNLHPALKTHTLLLNVRDVEELRQICKQFETLWARTGLDPRRNYDPTRRRLPGINEIQGLPDLDQYSFEQARQNVGNYPPTPLEQGEPWEMEGLVASLTPPKPKLQGPANPAEYTICWNCQDIGHFFKDCPVVIHRIFCYGCGKEGTIKNRCNFCQDKLARKNIHPNAMPLGAKRSDNWKPQYRPNHPQLK